MSASDSAPQTGRVQSGEAATVAPYTPEQAASAVIALFRQEVEAWWGRKAACRAADERESTSCDCSTKDCYEHGYWHNCSCGEPDWGPRAAAAIIADAQPKDQSDV